jgi:hypothetical protein
VHFHEYMSEPESPPAPQPSGELEKIDFDRAEFAETPPAGNQVTCGLCKNTIATEYWQYLGKVLCEGCREVVEKSAGDARRASTLGKAFLVGGGVAFGCGVGYAIFVGLSNIQFALVTIGIGWAVGTAIQRVTRGFGSRKHQVLAVVLTYCASSMGYLPAVFTALRDMGHHSSEQAAGSAGPQAPTVTPSSPPEADPAPAAPPPKAEPGTGALAVVLVLAFTAVLTLAAPLTEISGGFNGILGILIIFFGLRTAWRVSKGVEGEITGPHRVAAASA